MADDAKIQTYDSSANQLGQKISTGGTAVVIGNLETAVRDQANKIATFIIQKSIATKIIQNP
jgi:hypothetical protein